MDAVDMEQLAALRREYSLRGLDVRDLAPTWLETFRAWLGDAVAAELPEPNAMVVATSTADAVPSVRYVLLKGYDERGFTFFTNLDSRKGRELRANPAVSLLFPWHPLQRQVRVDGRASLLDRDEVQAYFDSRPRPARVAAWASHQSAPLTDRAELESSFGEYDAQFADLDQIPAPEHWGGVRVAPESVEFWQGRPSRLHDRLQFVRAADGAWSVRRLAP
jgi:pyridoxamine 5'-phosphate oxidase